MPEPSSRTSTVRSRAIDIAMADRRLAKDTVRTLWMEQAKKYHKEDDSDDVPLYLTLSGAEAHDIRLLADNNLINLTETGGIAIDSISRVVAIEKDQPSALNLQRLLPGLQIVTQNVSNLISGDSLINFPQNPKHVRFCCSKIVNLDLTCSLEIKSDDGNVKFPIISWIEKISLLHAEKRPQKDWCLLLTLNGTINPSHNMDHFVKEFLQDNYRQSEEFRDSCSRFLGESLQQKLLEDSAIQLSSLQREDQMKVLMIIVPKKISQVVHRQNWNVNTLWNLRYGGNDKQAPMVTWVLNFSWDSRASVTPNAVYIESLKSILSSAGLINDDGQIQRSSQATSDEDRLQ